MFFYYYRARVPLSPTVASEAVVTAAQSHYCAPPTSLANYSLPRLAKLSLRRVERAVVRGAAGGR
jgi:hypothetical protein